MAKTQFGPHNELMNIRPLHSLIALLPAAFLLTGCSPPEIAGSNADAIKLLPVEAAPGSMGPKIQSAVNFIKGGGKACYITKTELFEDTLKGKSGTTITG